MLEQDVDCVILGSGVTRIGLNVGFNKTDVLFARYPRMVQHKDLNTYLKDLIKSKIISSERREMRFMLVQKSSC